MLNYKDIFYSFTLKEIKGFEEIGKAVAELSHIPDDFKNEELVNNTGKERHLELRKSLDSEPNKIDDLKREAKMHLNKVVPLLKNQESSQLTKKKWEFRPGHISFNNAFMRLQKLNNLVSNFFDYDCGIAGDFLYPPNGFRTWHTNKFDVEGWFAFFVDVNEPNSSFFKFVDSKTNKVITHLDKPMTVNIFKIDKSELFWHCIGTNNCYRWSQGFTLPNNWKEKIELWR